MAEQAMMFGEELRRMRIAAKMSLARLGSLVHYSTGYLSKIETGTKSPTHALALACDTTLGAGGALVALVPRHRSEEAQTEGKPETGDEVWSMYLLPDGASSFRLVGRRDAVMAGAASLLELGVNPRKLEAAAQLTGTLSSYRALFDLTRQLGQNVSPSMVLPTVIGQTRSLCAVAQAAKEPVRRDMLILAAHYAEYAGWMAQEAGSDKGALWWTEKAAELATAAGDRQLASYALIRQGLVTLYRDDAKQTVKLAERARADSGLPPRILGLAAQREAQGHALAVEYDKCRRSLDLAAGLLAHASEADEPHPARPTLGTTAVSDPVALAAGWCMHDLGRYAEAVEILDTEVPKIPQHAVRARTRFEIRRALAYANLGDIDQACTLTGRLLTAVEAIDSATITLDLRRIARTLSRWHTDPQVQQLYPALTAALQSPSLS